MSNDITRSKEIACAPYGVAHGPSTPRCDAFFKNQCAHFRALTRGLGTSSVPGSSSPCGCFNYNVGEEYICPKVGVPLGKGGHICQDCHHLRPSNLGEHYICGGSLTEAGLGATMTPRISPPKGCRMKTQTTSEYKQEQQQYTNQNQNQSGGASQCWEGFTDGPVTNKSPLDYSSFYRPVYNSCDGCITQYRCNPYDGPMDYNLANYTDCAGSPVKVRTRYLPSAQCGRNFSTVVDQNPVTLPGYNPKDDTALMCNGRERCGNGLCSRPLCSNHQGKNGQNCCKRFNLATSCYDAINTARARQSPWVYGCDDIPSWYLDLAGPIVGGRPQWRRGTNNSVPCMLLKNTTNLPGRRFDCRQPCWTPDCV